MALTNSININSDVKISFLLRYRYSLIEISRTHQGENIANTGEDMLVELEISDVFRNSSWSPFYLIIIKHKSKVCECHWHH